MKISERKRRSLELALTALLLLTAVLAAAAGAEAHADAPSNEVQAANVDELLAAIAPNTTITLTGRSYNLTEAADYGGAGTDFYHWNEIYDDGWELVIDHVQGLSIKAARPGTEIVTVPRYACVLKFESCRDIALEGFTAGHTDGPGFCTGAVINLTNCRDVRVEGCDLYGCGTYGLELYRSRGVKALDTTIRDCSYGAVNAVESTDFLLDGCKVYGIESYLGVFSLSSCRDCAVINSLVRNNAGGELVWLSATRDFYIAGCEISGNRFNGMFSCTTYPVVLEGCAFKNNDCEYGWYYDEWQPSEHAVDPSGRTYSDEELDALTLMKDAKWSAPEKAAAPVAAPAPSEDGMIHVRTVDELLASIGPDVSIYLEDGVYDLSEAADYGLEGGEYYSWMLCYDGPGLVIQNVENLSITGAGPHRASITAEPRYADVLGFDNCKNITLKNLTAGHSQAPGDCAGGVLNFMGTSGVVIEDCSLYGCGVMGVTAYDSADMQLLHTEIHHCSYGALSLQDSRDVRIEGCNVHDIPGSLYQIFNCENVSLDGAPLQSQNW